jgi:hypothetical protein
MEPKVEIYRLYGIDVAMEMLRPGAKYEISNTEFTRWEDPRPCPTWEEVKETMIKLKELEDSIQTIWREDQIKELAGQS